MNVVERLRNHRFGVILLLGVTLLLCTPPLLTALGTRLSTHTMENVALVTSQETWLRWHEGESDALLLTSNDFKPRFEKPPLLTWLNFLAWSDLDPRTSTPIERTYRARLVTAALGLVMLAAIFWMGCTLADVRTAALATLIAGSIFFFQRQARTASYDIHFVTWVTLAVAAGLWAIVLPRKPLAGSVEPRLSDGRLQLGTRSKGVLGWLICGLAMGLAVLSKNPLALAMVVLPLAAVIAVNPGKGESHAHSRVIFNVIGLIGALALACLIFGPWYLYVLKEYENANQMLGQEFSQPRDDPQPLWYYAGLLALVLPWTFWLIGGLAQPFAANLAGHRRTLLVSWVWFVLILVMFSSFDAKQQRYILPIVPAAALLTAQFFREQQSAADRGVVSEFWQEGGSIVWISLMVVSAAFGPFLALQDWLVEIGGSFMPEAVVTPVPWLLAVPVSLGLLLLAATGWRAHTNFKPMRAGATLAFWALLATTSYWPAYATTPTRVQQFKQEAERIANIIGEENVYSLRLYGRYDESFKLNEEFRFYFGRLIRHVRPDHLEEPGIRYVMAKREESYGAVLQAAGFELVCDVNVDADDLEGLWRR